jgi:hypothetical protein
MARPLSRKETAALVEYLSRLLAMVDADEIEATTAMRHRIEGAVEALNVVLGGAGADSPLLSARIVDRS